MVDTIKFSQMTDGGDINNDKKTPGLKDGGNVLFNNPWTFLPPGTTAQRPTPSATVNFRLRFNTQEQLYEYYDAVLGAWTQLQESLFTQGPFVIYTADASIPDAQNLGALANGILKQTITMGSATLNIAVNEVDYYGPGMTGYLQAPAGIKDTNGNIIVGFLLGNSGANQYVTLSNGIAGDPASVSVAGAAANIQLDIYSKGTGPLSFNTQASSSAYFFFTGTNYQHSTAHTFANTANSVTVTWPDASGTVAFTSGLTGFVTGPASATDNALVRFDSTTGKLVKNSVGILDNAGALSGLSSLSVSNFVIAGNSITGAQINLISQTSGISAQVLVANASFDIIDHTNTISTPLRLFNAAATFATGFKAGNPVANTIYTLPIAFPGSTQALVSSNTGVMSFQSLTSGTVTSITAGSNLTGGTITTSGTIALSNTPSGLTSIGVGNFTISGSTIAEATGSIINLSTEKVLITGTLGDSGEIRFGHSSGGGYKGLKALSEGTTFVWFLPPENVENGLMQTNVAGELFFTLTPSGLTSLGVGNLTLLTSQIISSAGPFNFDVNGNKITLNNGVDAAEIRFFNSAGTQYTGLAAGALSASTTFILPLVDAAGVLRSNGSAVLSFSAAALYTPNYIKDCTLTFASTTTLTVSSGIAIDSTGLVLITSAGYTLDFTTSGANGLDTGVIASNQIYSIWLIRKSSDGTTASLASLSVGSSPTVLPSGYDQYRRIGWWTSQSGALLTNLIQYGKDNVRTYNYADIAGGINRILAGGSATTDTLVDCSAFVPSGCSLISMQVSLVPTVLNAAVFFKSENGNYCYKINNPATTGILVTYPTIILSTARKFYYKWDTATQAVFVDIMTFVDDLS